MSGHHTSGAMILRFWIDGSGDSAELRSRTILPDAGGAAPDVEASHLATGIDGTIEVVRQHLLAFWSDNQSQDTPSSGDT